jgi:ABC-2 type transport system permease protein
MSDTPPIAEARAAPAAVRPFYWSVRRELWENRGAYMAPLIAAVVVLAGILIATVHPPHFEQHGPGRQMSVAELRTLPYAIAAAAISVAGAIAAVFYCLGALHNERRDRSVLFWKSLPVSDVVAVASKAFVAAVVLPLWVFCAIVVTHLVMLVLHLAGLAAHGEDAGALLTQIPLLKLWLVLGWGVVTFTLWWAPIWGWLFMVSAWARRTPILWAVLPPIVLSVFERLAFGTSYVSDTLNDRLSLPHSAFSITPRHGFHMVDLPDPDPIGLLATPGLWIGFVIGAALIVVAVRLRRRAEPI